MRVHRPIPGFPLEQQPEEIVSRCLAVGEARGEQDDGGRLEATAMAGVLWVPRTRQKRQRWAQLSLVQIMLAEWQFSCFNPNDANRALLLDIWKTDPNSWERADTVADLIESGLVADPTGGATHYCTLKLWNSDPEPGDKVQWYHREQIELGRTHPTTRIGSHQFAVAP